MERKKKMEKNERYAEKCGRERKRRREGIRKGKEHVTYFSVVGEATKKGKEVKWVGVCRRGWYCIEHFLGA